jgi:hypothetical protein
MSLITTGSHPKALWPGVRAWFGAEYDKHPKEYTELFDVMSSSQNYEEVVEHGGFGLVPVKTQGASTGYQGLTQGVTARFTHTAYGLGYIVTREELKDNLYERVSRNRAAALAFSFAQTRENVGAQVYNRAFSSSYVGADGKELLATDHPTANASTYSNELATPASFSEAALEDLTIQIMQATDSKGLKINLVPKKLIGPVNLVYEFERVLKTVLQPDSANNNINAIKAMGVIPSYSVNHYLTDTNNWFIKTNAPHGLMWFDREAVEFTKDEDFDTDNAKAKGYMRFTCGWAEPRALYGSAPA